MAKVPPPFNDREMRATMRELAGMLAMQCPTRLGVAFMAAEMLFHMGRGTMLAEVADGRFAAARLTVHDTPTALQGLPIFEAPATPTKPSIVEDLFLGFVKSIANNQPVTKRENWKSPADATRDNVCAYAFLMGNIAWQLAGSSPIRRDHVVTAFTQVQQLCVGAGPGGGPFCDWMPL